jgi:hypothetical protein
VQHIHFGATLAVILETQPHRQDKQVGKALLERRVAILRPISRITRPNRVRRNLSARRARLNRWAWVKAQP